MVAVGDQQLRVGELGDHGAMGAGVADPPHPVDRPVVVGDLGPGDSCGEPVEVAPGIALVQREDRREIVPGRLGQPQPVLLRPRLGALVRAHAAGPIRRHPDPAEQPPAHLPRTVGGVVLLGQRPDRRLAVGGEDPLQGPLLERLVGVLVAVAPLGRLRQVDFDDVERRAGEQLGPAGGVDDVVGRGDDVGERRDLGEVVVEGVERLDLGHRRRSLLGPSSAQQFSATISARA